MSKNTNILINNKGEFSRREAVDGGAPCMLDMRLMHDAHTLHGMM